VVRKIESDSAIIEVVKDYASERNKVWGIHARNREQNFALNLLMDPEVDFVSLLGQAGTGKTLLTLAAALMQTLETKRQDTRHGRPCRWRHRFSWHRRRKRWARDGALRTTRRAAGNHDLRAWRPGHAPPTTCCAAAFASSR
jgi:hypothetical protein